MDILNSILGSDQVRYAIIRHLSTSLGGFLVANGLMSSNQQGALLGSLFFLSGIAWSAYQKFATRKRLQPQH